MKRRKLFRVGNDIGDEVDVVLYQEIEAPAPIEASLPEIGGFVMLLGVQRGMDQVVFEESDLLVEGLSHAWGEVHERV